MRRLYDVTEQPTLDEVEPSDAPTKLPAAWWGEPRYAVHPTGGAA